jgi:hypothetical protein
LTEPDSPVIRDLRRQKDKDPAEVARIIGLLATARPTLHVDGSADAMTQRTAHAAVNLLARIFPSVSIEIGGDDAPALTRRGGAFPSLRVALEAEARGVNPRIDLARPTSSPGLRLTIGNPQEGALLVDAHGWLVHVSPTGTGAPWQGQARLPHPASPLMAAALGVGEIFKRVVHPEELAALTRTLSLLDYLPAAGDNPTLPEHLELGELVFFGMGSIACAAVYALLDAPLLSGHATIIDRQTLDDTNPRRYILMHAKDERARKAEWAAGLLESAHPALAVEAIHGEIRDWARARRPDAPIGLAIITADSLAGRREAADLLPPLSISATTEGRTATVNYCDWEAGMCPYCAYAPNRKQRHVNEDYARMTGLSIDRLNGLNDRYRETNQPDRLNEIDTTTMEAHCRLPAERFRKWVGRPFREFYEAELGEIYSAEPVTQTGPRLGMPEIVLPFVSAAAGALVASEILRVRLGLRANDNAAIYWHNTLQGARAGLREPARRDRANTCFCRHPDRRRWFAELRQRSASAAAGARIQGETA